MEGSAELKHKHLEFTLAAVSELSSSASSSTPLIARFSADGGVAELRFHQDSELIDGYSVNPGTSQVRKEGIVWFFVREPFCIYYLALKRCQRRLTFFFGGVCFKIVTLP